MIGMASLYLDLRTALGPGGWAALLAIAVGGIVRAIKSNSLDEILYKYRLPPIPKPWLPWMAIILGMAGMLFDAKATGASWGTALGHMFWGVLSGGLAIAGNETLGPLTQSLHPGAAAVLFGRGMPRKAGT